MLIFCAGEFLVVPGRPERGGKDRSEDDGVLQVSGEHTKEEQKSGKWQRIERAHGKVLRPLRFPENAKVEQVRVTVENRGPTVTVPSSLSSKPEFGAIEISVN